MCPVSALGAPSRQTVVGLRGRSVRLPGHDLDHPCPTIAQRVVGIEPLLPQAVTDQHLHAERRRPLHLDLCGARRFARRTPPGSYRATTPRQSPPPSGRGGCPHRSRENSPPGLTPRTPESPADRSVPHAAGTAPAGRPVSAIRGSAPGSGRSLGIGVACVVEPSISNMGYITLAQTAAERAEALPKSGNAEGATVIVSPLGGITVRIGTTPQGQGHRTVAAQVVADALGVRPEDVDVLTDIDTSTSAWSVASGNYSSRFSGVGAAAVHLAATKVAAKLRAIAAEALDGDADEIALRDGTGVARRRERLAAAARRHRALESSRPPARARAGPPRDRVLRTAEPRASGRRGPHRLVGRSRLHRRRRRRRGRSRDRRDRRARLRDRSRRGDGC